MISLRRNSILIILALLPLLGFGRGKESPDTISARRAFVEMPEITLDILSRNARLDMLDYFDNDSIYRVTNTLHGQSYIETLTPDFMSVSLTPVSRLQIKVLRLKDGREILMTIHTVGSPQDCRDSEVTFYDASLRPLPTDKYFPELRVQDFFDLKGYKTKVKEIEDILPFHAFAIEANADNDDLRATLSYQDTLSIEDTKIIEMFLKPSVTFVWNGRQYKKQQ